MPHVKIGIGKSDFSEIRKDKNYYIDKTELIYDLIYHSSHYKLLYLSRPRRFGKTLTMSMLESFFDINKKSSALFDGLNITKHRDFCKEWMNQVPVLFISFKDVEALSYNEAYNMLKARVSDICKKYSGLLDSDRINPGDSEIFQRLMYKEAGEEEIKNSLLTIMRMMYDVYKKQVILLIDEYDVPLAKASENHYYEEMLNIIRGIMSIAVKDNTYLKFSVVTGCLRIAKESIFTGANNFASYSVLDDAFSEYFGFTEMEVKDLLTALQAEDKLPLMKNWYDGYHFGRHSVYCPWDVMNYAAALLKNKDAVPKNYWKNSSHNGIILTFVERTDFDVTDKFESLLNGGTVTENISDELTYDTLHESEENLWSVLLMTGYLTASESVSDEGPVSLKIPNKEIANIFEEKVTLFFENTMNRNVQKELISALWEKKDKKASELLSDLLWETISYNDYHENYYHAFITGIFTRQSYSVKSNQENGLGRTDIIIRDRKNRRAIIIETKKSKSKEQMEKSCMEGLEQIKEKEYIKGLDGYRTILYYGIAFYQKTALVICQVAE